LITETKNINKFKCGLIKSSNNINLLISNTIIKNNIVKNNGGSL